MLKFMRSQIMNFFETFSHSGFVFLPQAVWVLVDWSEMAHETGFPIKTHCCCFFPGTVSLHPSANYAFNGRVVHEGGAV